jgi:hypothetical protein
MILAIPHRNRINRLFRVEVEHETTLPVSHDLNPYTLQGYILIYKDRAMVHEVSRRSFTAQALVRSQSPNVRVVLDKVALGQGFLRQLRRSPVSIFPPTLHNHFHLHVALTRRTKRAKKTAKLPKCNDVTEIGKQWI